MSAENSSDGLISSNSDLDEDHTLQEREPKRCQRICKIVLVVGIVCLLSASLIVLALLLVFVGYAPPKIHLHCGYIEGTVDVDRHVYKFQSIPYAVPPVGDLRWRKSIVPDGNTCWEGILKTVHQPIPCVQMTADRKVVGHEDCLYLNVYTPTINNDMELHPVLVYFHPGDLRVGSINSGPNPTSWLTNEYNIVMVAVQYRLDVMGYLTLEEMEDGANFGLADQSLAVHWVKENIHLFGGNPHNVTIFGGSSVVPLLVAPAARGTFQQAWISSGSRTMNTTVHQAQMKNRLIYEKTGCHNLTCLKTMTSSAVTAAMYPEWEQKLRYRLPATNEPSAARTVVGDDTTLPLSVVDAWTTQGYFADVPIVIGSTAQETDVSMAPEMIVWTKEEMYHKINNSLSQFNYTEEDTKHLYHYTNVEETYTTICTDIRQTCLANKYAYLSAQHQQSEVYRYVVTYKPGSPRVDTGDNFHAAYASHGLDIMAFFQTFEDTLRDNLSDADKDFQHNIINNVLSFVRKGQLDRWRWKTAMNTTALIGSDIRFTTTREYNHAQCEHWEEIEQYAWAD